MESPVIPHMRDVLNERAPAAPVNSKGPALLAVLVFFALSAIGVILRLLTGSAELFLVSLIAGCVLAVAVFYASKKMFRSYSGFSLYQQAAQSYAPLFARIYAWGFEAAARYGEEIVSRTLPLTDTRQREFAAIDESLHLLLSRLSQLGQAKLLIGSEKELKKHCEKLSNAFSAPQGAPQNVNLDAARIELAALELRLEKLEQITQTALLITQELSQLKSTCEGIWENRTPAAQSLQLVISQRQKCIEKLSVQMNNLGL